MSDLIDRQRALDAFDYWVKSPMIGYSNGLLRLHEMLEEIPPVKPEPNDDYIRGRCDMWNELEDGKKQISELERLVNEYKKLEPKIGHWIRITNGAMKEKYICSECGRQIEDDGIEGLLPIKYPYCHCGAKMEGEE